MKVRTWTHSVSEALKGIGRNFIFSLASVGVITASLFIFGLFFFLTMNFRNIINSAESTVGITVFFEEDLSKEEKVKVGEDIESISYVSEVKYISAEEAWENYKKTSLKPELIETFGEDNPLADSDSYTVYVKKIEKQADIVSKIKEIRGVRKVNSNGRTASILVSINNMLSAISAVILGILLAISIFLISTTISMGISVRKEEIYIMRLIGATDFFVEAPFILEGMFIGLVGASLPLGILYFIYERATDILTKRFNTLANILVFINTKTIFSALIPLSLAIGIGIGFIGSYFTVRRHSNV